MEKFDYIKVILIAISCSIVAISGYQTYFGAYEVTTSMYKIFWHTSSLFNMMVPYMVLFLLKGKAYSMDGSAYEGTKGFFLDFIDFAMSIIVATYLISTLALDLYGYIDHTYVFMAYIALASILCAALYIIFKYPYDIIKILSLNHVMLIDDNIVMNSLVRGAAVSFLAAMLFFVPVQVFYTFGLTLSGAIFTATLTTIVFFWGVFSSLKNGWYLRYQDNN
ncbi:hypothetical protein GCM10010995_06050 [Cysteiniphilum litorale]|uniref:Uncharacterized protein n=2 Tax=Cysteiniphilum litorale TaxID=2056700 RepID=A0A8J2Z302_9GAMM|nr:hypothetical protein [Cysteiniphilum sp. SYW-8]GGF91623.1 hypothetical protein GCM10010995_06050 [Cysteiniphilum litorale]